MMRKLLYVILLTAGAMPAAPAITQGPWITGITRSTALFSWVTDTASTGVVKWGTSSGSLTTVQTDDGGLVKIHSWFASGMPANTTIYYRVCSTANGETCSAEATLTTLSQAAVPAAAAAPAPVDTPVTPAGTVRTVGANCNDPNTGLAAKWAAASWGDIVEIDPAITPMCVGNFVFPAKAADTQSPHRYILTRVKNAAANLTGRVAPSNKPQMARMIHNAPNTVVFDGTDPASLMCFAGDLRWRQFQSNAWAMYRCNNTSPKSITAIPPSGTLDITVPSHGYTTDRMVHVEGVTGPGADAVNGDWYMAVVDANTLRLRTYIGAGVQTAAGAASGGVISVDKYQLEPVTQGTALPAACAYGTWWHKQAGTGTEGEYDRTYYCNATNEWVKYRIDINSPSSPEPVIDLATNKAHHLLFQGISFEPLALKADPQRAQYKYQPTNQQSGSTFWKFVAQTRYNHHISWNQTMATCPEPSLSGAMVRCFAFASPLDGAHITVEDSYFAGFQIFHSKQDLDDGSAGVLFIQHGPGPHRIQNNYIECAGICVYYADDVATTSRAGNLTFKQNQIVTPDKFWDQSPSWIGGAFPGKGLYWSQRHRFELKRGSKILLDGNVFDGGWSWNNNAAAICLCTRGGAGGAQVSAVNGATVTTYDASSQYDWGVEDLKVGDLVYFSYLGGGTCTSYADRVFTVASLINTYSFTVSPSTGCTGGRGNIVRLNNDTAFVSDVSITNNTIKNAPTGTYILGHDSYAGGPGLPSHAMQRVEYKNNLWLNVDGNRVGYGAFSGNPSVAPTGSIFIAIHGMEDMVISHNTSYGRPKDAFLGVGVGGPASGLSLKANIFEYGGGAIVNRGTYFGKAALDQAWKSGTGAGYTADYNVILRPGGGSGAPNDPSSPPFGPYPARTKWFNSSSGVASLFKDAANGDVSLLRLYRKTDACFGSAGDCTDDGEDVGVNMTKLGAAQAPGSTTPVPRAAPASGNAKAGGRLFLR